MTMIESKEPPGTVVQVFQKGYLLNDRVLRPALVAVAKSRRKALPKRFFRLNPTPAPPTKAQVKSQASNPERKEKPWPR